MFRMEVMDTRKCSFLFREKNYLPTKSSQMPPLLSKPLPALQLAVPNAGQAVQIASHLTVGASWKTYCVPGARAATEKDGTKKRAGSRREFSHDHIEPKSAVRSRVPNRDWQSAVGERRALPSAAHGPARTSGTVQWAARRPSRCAVARCSRAEAATDRAPATRAALTVGRRASPAAWAARRAKLGLVASAAEARPWDPTGRRSRPWRRFPSMAGSPSPRERNRGAE